MGKIYTLKYLPEFFHDIIDFAELCKTYDVEFLLLEKEYALKENVLGG